MKEAVYKRNMHESKLSILDQDNKKRKQCKISDEKEEENKICNGWAHLPSDLFEEIMKRLPLIDYLGLRAVCSPWRAIITNAIANKHCLPLPELPLIVLQSLSANKLSLHSLSKEGALFCAKTVPIFEGIETCLGSVEGWLIVSKQAGVNSLAISFLNPMTNARFSVPSLLQYYPPNPPNQVEVHMTKMVASSNPNCSDRGCFVAGIFLTHYYDCGIAYYRLSDNSWTIIKADHCTFLDIEIHDEKLYVITDHHYNHLCDCILVYDLRDQNHHHPPRPKILAKGPQAAAPILFSMYLRGQCQQQYCQDPDNPNGHYFLANDNASGDLLLIRIIYSFYFFFRGEPHVTKIEVFKLDMNDHWVKITNLGDRILFLSKIQCTVLSSDAVLGIEEEEGGLITINSIYFAFRPQCAGEARSRFLIGVFCFTDNTTKYFSVERVDFVDTFHPFWFTPSTAW